MRCIFTMGREIAKMFSTFSLALILTSVLSNARVQMTHFQLCYKNAPSDFTIFWFTLVSLGGP